MCYLPACTAWGSGLDAESVIARVDQILINDFELDPKAVVPSATLADDLDLDSLDGLDLVSSLENEFGIRVDDDRILDLKTVGDIHVYVRTVFEQTVLEEASPQ